MFLTTVTSSTVSVTTSVTTSVTASVTSTTTAFTTTLAGIRTFCQSLSYITETASKSIADVFLAETTATREQTTLAADLALLRLTELTWVTQIWIFFLRFKIILPPVVSFDESDILLATFGDIKDDYRPVLVLNSIDYQDWLEQQYPTCGLWMCFLINTSDVMVVSHIFTTFLVFI